MLNLDLNILGFKNGGKHCWWECDEKRGPCTFCGKDGLCCRKGVTGNGCDGIIGGHKLHACVPEAGESGK